MGGLPLLVAGPGVGRVVTTGLLVAVDLGVGGLEIGDGLRSRSARRGASSE